MSWAVVGTVLIAVAFWVGMPDPRHQLLRLETGPDPSPAWLVRLVRGREGAPALRVRVLLGVLVGCVLLLALPGASGIVAAIAASACVGVAGGQVSTGRRATWMVQAELADTVELLAVCLAAGASMTHALEVVAGVSGAATAPVLAKVSHQLQLGVPQEKAWLELSEDEAWGVVARDVARSARSGTSLVEVLHVHADEARLVAQEQALQRARTAGVRSVVPLMACFLPAFVLVGVLPVIAGLLEGLLSR